MSVFVSKLDVSKLNRSSDSKEASDEVKVTFEFPDGKKETQNFASEMPIASLKLALETKHSIPYATQEFYYQGKEMPDPMCLCDYDMDPSIGLTIVVKINPDHADGKVEDEHDDDDVNVEDFDYEDD